MSTIVLDASAVIAALKREPGGTQVIAHEGTALITSINYAEVISHFVYHGLSLEDVDAMLQVLPIMIVAADEMLARKAGALRAVTAKAGLSLGDRFCLALAMREGVPAWTTDRQWEHVDGVEIRFLR